MQSSESRSPESATLGQDLTDVLAAHVVMLRDEAIIEEAVAGALLNAIDAVGRDLPTSDDLAALITTTDERIDALMPPAARGAISLGRGTPEVAATLLRLLLRHGLLAIASGLNDTVNAVLTLADAHTITLMPAYSSSQPAQPTTFAHYLGGLNAPLQRAGQRLPAVFAEINQSPMGAVALTSSSLGISRERTAALLGFAAPIPNTYDALAATDHITLSAELISAIAAPLRRFADELLIWLRTQPGSFRLADDWLRHDPAMPQVSAPARLERFVAQASEIEGGAHALADLARRATYQPVTTLNDRLATAAASLLSSTTDLLDRATRLFAGDLQVNRAYLANRAGRAFTTASDLAIFLMVEEGLLPVAARDIAQLTLTRAIDEGLEISGVTPERIDAAALAVIGRELKVELETISRYLAPRRFLERREATGSPAPAMTRAYLEQARAQLDANQHWLERTRTNLQGAQADLRREVAALIAVTIE